MPVLAHLQTGSRESGELRFLGKDGREYLPDACADSFAAMYCHDMRSPLPRQPFPQFGIFK